MATRYIQGNDKVQGSTDGVAPAAGYVGEVSTQGFGAELTTAYANETPNYSDLVVLSLNKGTYRIQAKCSVGFSTFGATTGGIFLLVRFYNSTTTTELSRVGTYGSLINKSATPAIGNKAVNVYSDEVIVTISADSTSVKLQASLVTSHTSNESITAYVYTDGARLVVTRIA